MLTSWVKQPLLHFLLAGMLIFGVNHFYADTTEADAAPDSSVITVDRAALLDFMQYRAKVFDADMFSTQLDAMSAEEVDVLVDDYVRQEALYREALSMGMEQGDPVIQERLVQKVEFLLENLVVTDINPTDAQLAQFYETRKQAYQLDAVYSFTHIFFDAQQGGLEAAHSRAEALLGRLGELAPAAVSAEGDRFPFLQNYDQRTRDFVSNNFSADFVAALDALTPNAEVWQGPIRSRYGYHLIKLSARSAPFIPAISEISERLLDDYRYEVLLNSRREAEAKVIAEYEVLIRL